MELRKRSSTINYAEQPQVESKSSGEKKFLKNLDSKQVPDFSDDISDNSSAEECEVVVANKRQKKVVVPRKKNGLKQISECKSLDSGGILKYTVAGMDIADIKPHSNDLVVEDTDDEFESPPWSKKRKGKTEDDGSGTRPSRICRSRRVTSYREASSDSEAENVEEKTDPAPVLVPPKKDVDVVKEACGDEKSEKRELRSRKCKSRKIVVTDEEDEDQAENPKKLQKAFRNTDSKQPASDDVKMLEADNLKNVQKDESESKVYNLVDKYGLANGLGELKPLVKSVKGLEKILAARNRDGKSVIYCVKENGKSYRNVVNIEEHVVQKHAAQLLRCFSKRLESLGRVDGHVLDDEDGPAFDPQYLVMDRIVAAEQRGKSKQFLVKWKGLPYSESTWETLEDVKNEEAYERFNGYNMMSLDGSRKPDSPFKDGRMLRDYQNTSLSWLHHNFENRMNCILADEMGLGKTIQSIAMLENLRHTWRIKGPFLVIAPVSTLGHWQREIESLTDMNCVVYAGNHQDRSIIQQHEFWHPKRRNASKFNVLVTGFEILMKDLNIFLKLKWQYLVVDEAHRLKSKDSKTTSALRQIDVRRGGLLFLTGTPIQNNMKEIFSLLNLLDPAVFDSEDSFLEKYGNLKDAKQVKELQEKVLRPRLLRRMKEDVEKSIPQKEETIIWVELTKDQRLYYRAMYENRILDLMKGAKCTNMPNLRNLAMELRKLCNHPFLCQGLEEDLVTKYIAAGLQNQNSDGLDLTQLLMRQTSGKMLLIDKILPMLKDAGRRVLIFSQFTTMLDILEDYLVSKNYSFERIDGKIRGSERQAAIDRYSAKDSNTFVFLLSTKAGGLGITLTAADTCIIYDSDWNPQNDLQAIARCHRIGQKKDVKVYRLIVRNTYEQHLFECSSRKYGLDEAILGDMPSDGDDKKFEKNIESLLKHGAYDILKEDGEAATAEFTAQNIEQILESRTEKRLVGGRGNSSFSVATFVSRPECEKSRPDLEMNTTDFWEMVLPGASKAAKDIPDGNFKSLQGRRSRNKVNYKENFQTSDSESSDDEDVKLRKNSSIDSDHPVLENGVRQWSEQEIKRIEHWLVMLGKSRIDQIMHESHLEQRCRSEVQEIVNALIEMFMHLQAKDKAKELCHELPAQQTNGLDTSNKESTAKEDGNTVDKSKTTCKDIAEVQPPTIPAFAEKVMTSQNFQQRIQKSASRYLQLLHEGEVLAEALQSNDGLPPSVGRNKYLPFWWGDQEDLDLMKGAHKHGHRSFKRIRIDPDLCFAAKSGADVSKSNVDTLTQEASKSVEDEILHDQLNGPGLFTDWPSDAVLQGRLRKLIESLPNGLSQVEKEKRAARIEAAKKRAAMRKIIVRNENDTEDQANRPGSGVVDYSVSSSLKEGKSSPWVNFTVEDSESDEELEDVDLTYQHKYDSNIHKKPLASKNGNQRYLEPKAKDRNRNDEKIDRTSIGASTSTMDIKLLNAIRSHAIIVDKKRPRNETSIYVEEQRLNKIPSGYQHKTSHMDRKPLNPILSNRSNVIEVDKKRPRNETSICLEEQRPSKILKDVTNKKENTSTNHKSDHVKKPSSIRDANYVRSPVQNVNHVKKSPLSTPVSVKKCTKNGVGGNSKQSSLLGYLTPRQSPS